MALALIVHLSKFLSTLVIFEAFTLLAGDDRFCTEKSSTVNESIVAVAGTRVTLQCYSTCSGNVVTGCRWYTLRINGPSPKQETALFNGRHVPEEFAERYSVDKYNISGCSSSPIVDCILTIKNVTADDAGFFECLSSTNTYNTFALTVLDSEAVCHSALRSPCNDSRYIEINCRVGYRGCSTPVITCAPELPGLAENVSSSNYVRYKRFIPVTNISSLPAINCSMTFSLQNWSTRIISNDRVDNDVYNWNINLSAEAPECGGHIANHRGQLSSSNSSYDCRCMWNITVQPDYRIQLNITRFVVEDEGNCDSNSLEVYDGATRTSHNLILRLCNGSQQPHQQITTSGSNALVYFRRTSYLTSFEIDYKVVPRGTVRSDFLQRGSNLTLSTTAYPTESSSKDLFATYLSIILTASILLSVFVTVCLLFRLNKQMSRMNSQNRQVIVPEPFVRSVTMTPNELYWRSAHHQSEDISLAASMTESGQLPIADVYASVLPRAQRGHDPLQIPDLHQLEGEDGSVEAAAGDQVDALPQHRGSGEEESVMGSAGAMEDPESDFAMYRVEKVYDDIEDLQL